MVLQRKIADRKLLKLKKWVLVSEAAQLLSGSLGEEVSEASLVRLALDGEIKLSVYFLDSKPPARPCLGGIADLRDPPEIKGIQDLYWLGRMLNAEDKICHLDEELYDLPLIGAERSIVHHYWQQLRGAPVGEYIHWLETVVEGQDGKLYLLQEFYLNDEPAVDFAKGELTEKLHFGAGSYGPSNGFPVDAELVVRRSELLKLEGRFDGGAADFSEKAIMVENERDTTEPIKPKRARLTKDTKKEPGFRIFGGVEEPSLSDKIIEEQCAKRQVGPETGYHRLEQILGNPKKGILPFIPVSKSTWWAWVKSGRAPKPIKLSTRCTVWKSSDIIAFKEKMERGED